MKARLPSSSMGRSKLFEPRLFQTSPVSSINIANSSGSIENELSGPLSARLIVKCFSIAEVPKEVAVVAEIFQIV